MKQRGKYLLQLLLLIALTSFALWFALKDDGELVLSKIIHVPWYWLLVIILFAISYYLIQGYILYRFGKRYKNDIHIWDGIQNAYIAAFFNGVTPLGGGQVAQTYALRKLSLSYSDIASILWKDFFLYQIVILVYALCLLLVFFPFAWLHYHAYFFLVIAGFLINSSVIVILWTMSKFPKFYMKASDFLIRSLTKLHIVKDSVYMSEKWQGQIKYFNEEIRKMGHEKKDVIITVLLNIFRQTIFYSLPMICAKAYGIHIPISDIFYVIAISSFIHMLNALTPLPGDSGWSESTFIVLFAVLFGRTDASGVMLLWRAASYHINVIIGGIIFLYVKSYKHKKKQNAVETSLRIDIIK